MPHRCVWLCCLSQYRAGSVTRHVKAGRPPQAKQPEFRVRLLSTVMAPPQRTAFLWQYRAFREFPWHNGLVLQGSTIVHDLRQWLQEEPARHPDIQPGLLEVSVLRCHCPRRHNRWFADPSKPSGVCRPHQNLPERTPPLRTTRPHPPHLTASDALSPTER